MPEDGEGEMVVGEQRGRRAGETAGAGERAASALQKGVAPQLKIKFPLFWRLVFPNPSHCQRPKLIAKPLSQPNQ
jgi:hypothetical protein